MIKELRKLPNLFKINLMILLIASVCYLNLSIELFSQTLDEHVVAAYLFDEGKGHTVNDLSENGNHGEIIGAEWTNGKLDFGLEGNGTDAYVLVPDSESLDLTTGLTIQMWIYLNNYSTAGGNGVTKETTYKVGVPGVEVPGAVPGEKSVEIRMTTSQGAWAPTALVGETEISLKEWHNIAGTYDAASGEAKVYLDGKEIGSTTFGGEIVPNDEPLWMMRGNAPFLDGVIDEVVISNVARTEAEIKDTMRGLTFPVSASGKLSTVWGSIKTRY